MPQNDSQPRKALDGETFGATIVRADASEPASKVHAKKTGNRERVLVIDDDRSVADTLAMVLNVSGYDAIAVHSGEQGVELARQGHFDQLVTDVMMPGMNGIDVAIAVREALPGCRILLVSGNNNTTDLLASAAARGHTFNILAKPVHPTVLLEQMRAQSSPPVNTPPASLPLDS